MARFVSRSQELNFVVDPGHAKTMVDVQGVMRSIVEQPIYAQFQAPAPLSPYETAYIMQIWGHRRLDGTRDGFGAHADPHGGEDIIVNGRRVAVTQPHRLEHSLSYFDTDLIPDPETRELFLTRLRTGIGNGTDYVEIPPEQLSPPWATYDSNKPSEIVSIAKKIGADLHIVLRYERATLDRRDVITSVEAELERLTTAKAEQDALSVTVQ